MKITANSKEFTVAEGTTISAFLSSLGRNPARCVVEYNGKALAFSAFANIVLSAGDRLEIMGVVAGG